MPELPEVETVTKALNRALVGKRVLGARFIGKMRMPFSAKAATRALAGKRVDGVRRRAKYIVIDFEGGDALLSHLGMTGYFHIDPADAEPHKHDRAAFPLDDGQELRYADARRFGFVKLARTDGPDGWPSEIAALGLEPFARQFNAAAMKALAENRKTPIKAFLMDQAVVAGIGNIYASEALFGAGIDPRSMAGKLDGEEWKRLVSHVRKVLRKAIRKGGSTIINYRTVDGAEGSFQRILSVYGRAGEPCRICGSAIVAIRQAGRSTFFCPECQK